MRPCIRNVAVTLLSVWISLTTHGCGDSSLTNLPSGPASNLCRQDSDCDAAKGELCIFGECVDAACRGNQAPLLSVNPTEINFGAVARQPGQNAPSHDITVRNVGGCVLNVEGVSLSGDTGAGFRCDPCSVSAYPQRIAPGQAMTVTVSFDTADPGSQTGTLLLRSDDDTAGAQGLVRIPLEARYDGTPLLMVDPHSVNFGFVSYSATQQPNVETRHEKVRITNQGSGSVPLEITYCFIESGPFRITDDRIRAISPTHPLVLPPYNANDPGTYVDVDIALTPNGNQDWHSVLHVAARGAQTDFAEDVELIGSSVGPPKIKIEPTELNFVRHAGGGPLELGEQECRQTRISNIGQSDLLIRSMQLVDPSHDFFLRTSDIPPIPPGASQQVEVCYQPSLPSDPNNISQPTRATQSVVNILNNDPQSGAEAVILSGWARKELSDDFLKLEMTFDNADNSWAANDFRDVDMELESPMGYICTKPKRTYTPNGSGGYTLADTERYCDEWNAAPNLGRVQWLAVGAYEEPERIVLSGLGTHDFANDFIVRLYYVEDCARMPTGALASVLNIGLGALFGILGGVTGVGIPINPGSITQAIANSCFDHSSTVATVRVYINGQEVAAPGIRLGSKGDFVELVHLRRQQGRFSVVGSTP